ncbi:sodium-independent sulfate anion transporter-like isoform X2 [Stegodyphus dumicola]|uniref:sodium-independent sulfate anion transporter-like isoform X2 n=1 Tax=Stegodyphus dumicola TaxID=202533 RepID=UPI0015A7C4D7|nr:sodium-independent sulfate anion transporter-like isoform X2 [Stegodyphus dumicola]
MMYSHDCLPTSETWSHNDVKANAEIEPLQNTNSSSCTCLENWCNRKCTLKLLKRRLPIVVWLPKYSVEDLKGDLIAGITVALTVIPQGLALAMLAGLPPQYGLYTAFMGCFMYTIFGSCKDLTIGPTAIMSLMTSEHTAAGGVTYVILITFLSGCIQLLMGILNLGFLVTFISSSVVSGFTSAAAITIAMTQLAGVFGLYFKSEGFTEDVYHFFNGIKDGNMRYWDMTLGLSSIVFLLLLKCGSKINIHCNTFAYAGRICDTLLKTISTARNALLVLLCTGIAALLLSYDIDSLTLTQAVKPGLPSFAFPAFEYTYFNNATNTTVHKNFAVIVQEIGSGLIIIPLLCLLEAIAIAKSFAKSKKVDATQEMIAIGICNIMGSFVSAYPATGSFSRTAINYSSGVRTTAGGIVTGSLVLLALGVMSPYFCYIPKASLSALIFMAVLNMVHYKDVIVMWKTNKLDLLPFSATFIFSFILGLEYGIIIGIGISLGLLLLQESSLKLLIEDRKTFFGNSFLYVKPDRTVLFPSAECLQTRIIKSIPDRPDQSSYYIIIDCEHITAADYTMAMSMCSLINNMRNEGIKIIFINLRSNVLQAIAGTKPVEFHHHLSQEDAENFIDALSICRNSPPAYSGDVSRHSLRSDDVSFDS